MGTRASVSIVDDGVIWSIYNNFDGYEDHLGEVLKNHYNTFEKAQELILHGDASFIDKTLDECTFYHRDRGEEWDDVKPQAFTSILHAMEMYEQGYDYIFIDGEWKLINGDGAYRSF